ncbi:hypothetical protein [Falsiroseomonas sp. E2-1-a20]|uniref:hypothetical protein n=1 Tax=Falsiroseomonas sp. E2-1-a20 TaxID=3239300 RepID=UPI003F5A8B77
MDLATLTTPAPDASTVLPDPTLYRPRKPGILALDLGTNTGWALRFGDGGTTSGTMTFKPGRFEGGEMRFLRFTGWLVEIAMHPHGPRRVVFEEVRRHAGTNASHVYGGLRGRPRRNSQALRHRQGQRRQGCDDRRHPSSGLPAGRRQ